MAMVVKKILRSVYVARNGIKFTTVINLHLITKLIGHFGESVHCFGSHFVNNRQPNVTRLAKYHGQQNYYQNKVCDPSTAVVMKLSRTSNFIKSC